jgi:hypothetical protein
MSGEFKKTLATLSRQFAASATRRFKFKTRSQLFIRTHNETLSVAAMRVGNPDRSPVENQSLRRSSNSNRLCRIRLQP